jgi:hypothetical protein
MRIKIRQRDASAIREDGWSETGDWLAELGDDNHTEPPGDDHAGPDGTDGPWAEAFAQADAHARARARAEAPEEAATMPAAVMTTGLETGPDQLAITPDPAPANPLTATPRSQPRPLEVAQCSMCGIALPLALMVPDGGQACADIRWYCKDAMSCTHRWTTANTPGRAHMPTAPYDAVAETREAAPGRAPAEQTDSMVEAAQSAV